MAPDPWRHHRVRVALELRLLLAGLAQLLLLLAAVATVPKLLLDQLIDTIRGRVVRETARELLLLMRLLLSQVEEMCQGVVLLRITTSQLGLAAVFRRLGQRSIGLD